MLVSIPDEAHADQVASPILHGCQRIAQFVGLELDIKYLALDFGHGLFLLTQRRSQFSGTPGQRGGALFKRLDFGQPPLLFDRQIPDGLKGRVELPGRVETVDWRGQRDKDRHHEPIPVFFVWFIYTMH